MSLGSAMHHETKEPDEVVRLIKERRFDDLIELIDFSKLYRGVLHRFWIIIIFGLIGFGALGYMAYKMARIYVANAYLVYQRETPEVLPGGYPLNTFTKSSAIALATLPNHLQAANSILDLNMRLKEISELVDVSSPESDSNLIRIRVSSDDPTLSVELANTLASVTLKNSQEFQRRQLREARSYYQKQVNYFKSKAEELEGQIAQFRRDNKEFDFALDGTIRVKSLDMLETRLQQVEEEYKSLLIQYENTKREGMKIPEQVVQYSVMENPLKKRLENAEMALIEGRTRFAPANPRIRALEAEVTELRRLIQEASSQEDNESKGFQQYQANPIKERVNLDLLVLSGKIRSSQKLKEDIAEEYKEREKSLEKLPEKQLAYAILLADREKFRVSQKESENYLKAIDALLNTNNGVLESYVFASEAIPDESIVHKLLPILGALIGGFFGLMFTLFLELQDPKIRTSSQLQKLYYPPCITQIPEFRRLSASKAKKFFYPYIRHMEASIAKTIGWSEHFSLCVASSIDGEGKSNLISLLSLYYHRLGHSVLVLELDAKPGIQKFNDETAQPLENYLDGSAGIGDVIERGAISYIRLQEDTRQLDHSAFDQIESLIKEVKREYEIVLIDLPGLVKDHNGGRLCATADHTLFVVGSKIAKRKMVTRSLQDLEFYSVRPIGVVLNRALAYYLEEIKS